LYLRPTIIDTAIDIERVTQKEERVYQEDSDAYTGYRNDLNDLKEILNF